MVQVLSFLFGFLIDCTVTYKWCMLLWFHICLISLEEKIVSS